MSLRSSFGLGAEDPFAPHRQKRCHDHGSDEQADQAEGSQSAEDADEREQKRKPRRAADEHRPDEVVAGEHDDRAPR